ncbi:MAG: NAD(+)/NADH kinase [Pseudomonadota bacterium]
MAKVAIQRVLIVFRKDTQLAKNKAKELAHWLLQRNLKVCSHPKQTIPMVKKKIPRAKSLNHVDLVIALGGDGTYLEAVRMLQKKEIPILGINMGSLGFLTNVTVEDMYASIEKVLSGVLEMRPRSMLDVKHKRKGKLIGHYRALNEIVLERGGISHLINLSMFVEKKLIAPVKADGVIFSTPTGSTAYNLAANGPIMHPEASSFVMTPICPHSLTMRPIIIPDHLPVSFELNDINQKAMLTVDGVGYSEMKWGDQIKIKRCETDHFVLRDEEHNYFDLLREKLKFGERA